MSRIKVWNFRSKLKNIAIAVRIIKTPNAFWICPLFAKSQGVFFKAVCPAIIIKNIGIAVPIAYANVMKKASRLTEPVIASDITEAKIGPTQGVHKSPKESPIIIPPPNPVWFWDWGRNCESLEKSISIHIWNLGISIESPNKAITTTEKTLKDSAGIPNILTIEDKKSVKIVKLKTKPTITPSGLAFPICCVPIEEERMIGNIGKMHGERIVTIPAKNAKIIKSIIVKNKGSLAAFVS